MKKIGVFSNGILKTCPFLGKILEAEIITNPLHVDKVDFVVGWGYKKSSFYAAKIAARAKKPFVKLEDGFIRSVGLGCENNQALSIVADIYGLYYNAEYPSDLEISISKTNLSGHLLFETKRIIKKIVDNKITKYNIGIEHFSPNFKTNINKKILLIDQTENDDSIKFGLSSDEDFGHMVKDAFNLNAEIFIKVHPDVLSGKKKSSILKYLSGYDKNRYTIISEDVNTYALIESFEDIYVVTSQFGFESLLAGKNVVCYGAPFYSSWGLTEDKKPIGRRLEHPKTIEDLFYASCVDYAYYYNPIREETCSLEKFLDLIIVSKKIKKITDKKYNFFGFSRRKKVFIEKIFGPSLFFYSIEECIKDAIKNHKSIIVWASKTSDYIENICQKNNIKLFKMEDGFIRSVGLGCTFAIPYSLVLDENGIYFDSSKSDLFEILNNIELDEKSKNYVVSLKNEIISKKMVKYNIDGNEISLPLNKQLVLVPGQVEDDASIKYGSPYIVSNIELLKFARNLYPQACIIYKPHPDTEAGIRKGFVEDTILNEYCNIIAKNTDINYLYKHIDEVVTMTSLTGFEALIRNIKVTTVGKPFYAGWGLTNDILTFENRNRNLTLEELIYGVLVKYPLYYDFVSGYAGTIDDILQLLQNIKNDPKKFDKKIKYLYGSRFYKIMGFLFKKYKKILH